MLFTYVLQLGKIGLKPLVIKKKIEKLLYSQLERATFNVLSIVILLFEIYSFYYQINKNSLAKVTNSFIIH